MTSPSTVANKSAWYCELSYVWYMRFGSSLHAYPWTCENPHIPRGDLYEPYQWSKVGVVCPYRNIKGYKVLLVLALAYSALNFHAVVNMNCFDLFRAWTVLHKSLLGYNRAMKLQEGFTVWGKSCCSWETVDVFYALSRTRKLSPSKVFNWIWNRSYITSLIYIAWQRQLTF